MAFVGGLAAGAVRTCGGTAASRACGRRVRTVRAPLRRRSRAVVLCSGAAAEPDGPMFHQAAVPLISPDKQRTGMSLILLIATDKMLAALFEAIQLRFPSSLFGMLAMFSLLLLLDRVNPNAGKRVLTAYKPGVDFIAKWLAVCFVPTLVMLPLAPMPGSADLMRMAFAIVVCWVSSLVSIGMFAGFLQKMLPEGGEVGGASAPMVPPPYAKLSRQLGLICAGLFVVCLATGCARPVVTVYTLLATVFGFCVGTLPNKTVKAFVHPLITCALISLGAIALLGAASGVGFVPMLSNYVTRSADLTMSGGGDLLLSLLGPAVVSFGFQMYGRKQLMRARAPEVFGTTFFASVLGLFGTALVARVINVSGYVRLFLIPRQLTAPLAVRVSEMLGADVGLALSVVVLTGLLGANFGQLVLNLFRIKDPAARGLAMGSSSHGLGTAAISSEPDAFAFSATAMALVALTSTLLVTIVPIKMALLRVALGAL